MYLKCRYVNNLCIATKNNFPTCLICIFDILYYNIFLLKNLIVLENITWKYSYFMKTCYLKIFLCISLNKQGIESLGIVPAIIIQQYSFILSIYCHFCWVFLLVGRVKTINIVVNYNRFLVNWSLLINSKK